ncbi:MAG: TIGR02450 family Trp-rich protein [bacterium]|nr:TIGR02450 family Trp-rich protein [bacterium]
MNLNPDKLHHSKWTAVNPQKKEKHFVVTSVLRNGGTRDLEVVIEAVLTRRTRQIPWRDLTDGSIWMSGWT